MIDLDNNDEGFGLYLLKEWSIDLLQDINY